jgi:hypothetical protein
VDSEQYSDSPLYQKLCETKPEYGSDKRIRVKLVDGAFRIEGTLDFSLIGILADISKVLAQGKVGIFAISTYNTDYILTKSENFERAICLLQAAGYSCQ